MIDDNPDLRPRIGEGINRAYPTARIEAARETGLDEDQFPEQCSYLWTDIMEREFCRS